MNIVKPVFVTRWAAQFLTDIAQTPRAEAIHNSPAKRIIDIVPLAGVVGTLTPDLTKGIDSKTTV